VSIVLLILIAAVVMVAIVAQQRAQTRRRQLEAAELEKVKAFAAEDVTKFGEELQRLDTDVAGHELDEATRQDYERALDEYDAAKKAIDTAQRPEDIKQIASILEDGRYAMACVRARINGQPLPQRRPPCFFNPQHGPSTEDVEWAPPGGAYRRVPVCPADAERVRAGAEPDIRKVTVDGERVPYWQGGPAYAPWMQGYFAGYATSALLPAFLMTSMMGGWDGYGDGGYADQGADAGDAGDIDAGGDFGGGDIGGGDFGGDFGGGDFGF
jgi:hypothetical protein